MCGGEPGNRATWRVQANPISCQIKGKGIHHSEFLLCFLQVNEKGMHDLEFLFCFLQKKEKGMHQSEFLYAFFKKERAFLNSVFLFAAEGKRKWVSLLTRCFMSPVT